MELLFSTLIGAAIGLGVRYLLPGRDTYGSVLLPALAAAVTAIVWVGLVWAGWTFDGTWIWVVSIVSGGASALVVALLLPERRRTADADLQARLSRA